MVSGLARRPVTEPPARLRLVRVRVPLRRPHRSTRSSQDHRDSVLVGWTTADGVEGWGECPTLSSPGYAGVTTDEAWSLLVNRLGPAVVAGHSPDAVGAVAPVAALADAALDAGLRAAGVSLAAHLGARRRAVPRTTVLADAGLPAGEVVDRAVEARDGGAALVKVKAGPGAGIDTVLAVAAEVGAPFVAADANGAFGAAGNPSPGLVRIDRLGLAYLEQPWAPDCGWDVLASAAAGLSTPVVLDESLIAPDAVVAALGSGAARAVSVKPSRLGGVLTAASVVAEARGRNAPAFVGGMFELGIGRAAAAAVAALDGCTLPTDLGPSSQYVVDDVCEPIVVDGDGSLVVPDGPGIGRTPDEKVLEVLGVDRVELRRGA
jgi:o-succinylbenzoate synthase